MNLFESYNNVLSDETGYNSDTSGESDTCIYVINLDGMPLYYQKTYDKISENMWRIVNSICCADINYNYFSEQISEDTIKIYGKHRFLAVSYDKLHHIVNVTKIEELPQTIDSSSHSE